eukprot:2303830-Rhodomonas_salina.1
MASAEIKSSNSGCPENATCHYLPLVEPHPPELQLIDWILQGMIIRPGYLAGIEEKLTGGSSILPTCSTVQQPSGICCRVNLGLRMNPVTNSDPTPTKPRLLHRISKETPACVLCGIATSGDRFDDR